MLNEEAESIRSNGDQTPDRHAVHHQANMVADKLDKIAEKVTVDSSDPMVSVSANQAMSWKWMIAIFVIGVFLGIRLRSGIRSRRSG